MLHDGPIAGLAARGDYVASAGYDNKVILWDSRQRVALARSSHDHLVNNCAFSHDGHLLATASSDYTARIWSVPGLTLVTVLAGHEDDVDMAVFSPDDRLIATCALDRCVRVFDLDGRLLAQMAGHTGNVLSLAWVDAARLVSSSVDGTVRIWDAVQGIELSRIDLAMRSDSVAVAPDGTIFAAQDGGKIITIRDGRADVTNAHAAGIKKLVLDARRRRLISLSYDRTAAIWSITDAGLVEIGRTTLPDIVWARATALLDDGRLAVGTFGTRYALFDPAHEAWDLEGVGAGPALNAVIATRSGALAAVGDAGEVTLAGEAVATVGSLCNFLVDAGHRLLTGGQAGRLFDARSGDVLYNHHSPLNCGVAFERVGLQHVAIGTYTGEVLLFAVDDAGKCALLTELPVFASAVKSLSVGENSLFAVFASGAVCWLDIADLRIVARLERAHDKIANSCCALDGDRFASVSRDRKLRIWEGERARVFATPHMNSIKCIAADGTGTKLISGSYRGMVAVFDVATEQWTRIERPTAAGIAAVTWDERRSCFVAAAYDGKLYAVAA